MSDIRQNLAQTATSTAARRRPDSPYHQFNDPEFGKRAHCVYFYYVKPARDDQPQIVKSYYHDNIKNIKKKSRLLDIASAFAHNAVLPNRPPPNGIGFGTYPWSRRSYIVVLIDDPNWRFSSPACEFTNNISMYNCKHEDFVEIEDQDGSTRRVPIFYCLNHMKHSLGSDEDDLNGAQIVNFKLMGTTIGGNGVEATDAQDSVILADGTNLGPPVPPPSGSKIGPPFNKFPLNILIKLFFKLKNLLGV